MVQQCFRQQQHYSNSYAMGNTFLWFLLSESQSTSTQTQIRGLLYTCTQKNYIQVNCSTFFFQQFNNSSYGSHYLAMVNFPFLSPRRLPLASKTVVYIWPCFTSKNFRSSSCSSSSISMPGMACTCAVGMCIVCEMGVQYAQLYIAG